MFLENETINITVLERKTDQGFVIQLVITIINHILLHWVFVPTCVYYKCRFVTITFSKMIHGKILSEDKSFSKFYAYFF